VFFEFSTHPPDRFFGRPVQAARLFESVLQDGPRIELLKELLPMLGVMAYLADPSNPSSVGESKAALNAAAALRATLHVQNASTDGELDAAFEALTTLRVDGLVVAGDPFFDSRRQKIVDLAAKHAVTTYYAWHENGAAGGLISYGNNLADSYRQAGIFAGRVLKGEKPVDLPVMQPTKFELAVNLKTARHSALPLRQRCSPVPTR
jgi:putative tryptophan/tyrosine transport system substrate-binding protein